MLGYGWYVMEISALFLAMGIASGVADGQGADAIAKLFLSGCKDILSAALVVGLASGIIFILKDGHVIDTLLYGLTRSLAQMGAVASLGVMYLFQTLLNLVMPSGSAKAALTMPIMTQFADLINVSRQTTVLAFQFGDGFTNMITPTSGVLIGVLGHPLALSARLLSSAAHARVKADANALSFPYFRHTFALSSPYHLLPKKELIGSW